MEYGQVKFCLNCHYCPSFTNFPCSVCGMTLFKSTNPLHTLIGMSSSMPRKKNERNYIPHDTVSFLVLLRKHEKDNHTKLTVYVLDSLCSG